MKKYNYKLIFCTLFGFAIVLLVVATVIAARTVNYSKNGVKTYATITKIETVNDNVGDDNDVTHNVYVEFYVNGEKYEGRLDTYVYTMKTGKKVPVYYMPDDPNKFIYAGQPGLFPSMLYFFGLLALIISLYFPISAIKKKKLASFKKTATPIKAHITDTCYNERSSFLGKHKLKIDCADDSGNEYHAAQFVTNGENVYVTKEITVYVGKNGKYKIDLEEVCNSLTVETDAKENQETDDGFVDYN